MKIKKLIIYLIIIIFFKTETVLSEKNLFNVNNIQLEKKAKISNKTLTDQAIKKGYIQLLDKILLKKDFNKLLDLNFNSIKELVTYYQISTDLNEEKKEIVNFNITFDKDKIHELFYSRGISYSEILDKELYILPILIKNGEIFIFNNNFFYKAWNNVYQNDLIEFILPLENIEIIQNINKNKNNLIDVNLNELFKEYTKKNLAIVIFEENNNFKKVYIKSILQGKNISKSLNFNKKDKVIDQYYEEIITDTKKELINLVKSKNLIDIRTPSFLNVRFNLSQKSNLVELNLRIKNIDLVEKVYVQQFNKDYMNLKIKYLGKLEKIIYQLKKEKIELKLINEQWVINTL